MEDNINKKQLLSFNSKIEDIGFNSNKPIIISKIIDTSSKITKLYNTHIESKYIKIIKSKRMTLITWKLQKIPIDLQKLYDLPSLLGKKYITLFLDKFICKS